MTVLGARQYKVSLVWTRWSGGERGVGQEAVVQTFEILPTPLVADLNRLSLDLTAIGLNEVGSVRVSELSPRFNEDLLVGRDVVVRAGDAIPDDMNFYWEIYYPNASAPGPRRRFFPKSAPNKNPTKFEWTIDLVKSDEDRTRDEQPR